MTAESDTSKLLDIMCDPNNSTELRLHATRQLLAMNDSDRVYDYYQAPLITLLLRLSELARNSADPEIRGRAKETIEWLSSMIDPDIVHRVVQPYLGGFLEAFQEAAQDTTLGPETRREAKEYAEYLLFRKRLLGGDH